MKRRIIVPLLVGLILILPAQALAKDVPHAEKDKQSVSMRPEDPGASRGKAHQEQDAVEAEPEVDEEPSKDETRGKSHPKKESRPPTDKGDEPSVSDARVEGPPAAFRPSDGVPDGPVPGATSVEPVPAPPVELTVGLHPPHVGADSATFAVEPDDGGLTAGVVWHFVLNGLDAGTASAAITVRFRDGGTVSVSGRPVGSGSTQHFYVGTAGPDVLLGATAVVLSSSAGKLVLSHVSQNSGLGDGDDNDGDDDDNDDNDGDDGDNDDTDGDTDGDDDDNDGDDDHGDGDDSDDDRDGDTDDGDTPLPNPDEEPFLAFGETAGRSDGTRMREDYLPYTGDPGMLVIGLASLSAAAGGGAKRRSRSCSRRRR